MLNCLRKRREIQGAPQPHTLVHELQQVIIESLRSSQHIFTCTLFYLISVGYHLELRIAITFFSTMSIHLVPK